jgi:hypothetical protein
MYAQTSLADLERAATTSQQQWFTLASTMDTRVSRMLPCAPGATAAIEETHQASSTRMLALIAYTKAVADQSAEDLAMARRIQKAETDYTSALAVERTHTEEERAGVASQITNLTESVRKRVSLSAANDELRELEASVKDRATLVAANVSASEAVLPKFEGLVQALEKREAVVRKQVAGLENELFKWNGYYTARLARAQVECSGTGQ